MRETLFGNQERQNLVTKLVGIFADCNKALTKLSQIIFRDRATISNLETRRASSLKTG